MRRVKLGFAAVTLLASVLILEAWSRVLLPGDYSFNFVVRRVPDILHRFRRDRPYSEARDGVVYRFEPRGFRLGNPDGRSGLEFLFIGDSLTAGYRVQDSETLVAAAERRLRQMGLAARCLNAGVSSIGPGRELGLIRHLLKTMKPAAVVLQLFPANDLTDDWQDGGFSVESGRLTEKDPPVPPFLIRLRGALLDNRVSRHSHLVKLAANAFLSGKTFLLKPDEKMIELERLLLAEVERTLRAAGIPLLVIMIPSPREAGIRESAPAAGWPDAGDERVYGRAADMVREMGVPFLDLRPALDRGEFYIKRDLHLSPLGNEVVGKAVAERLSALTAPRRKP